MDCNLLIYILFFIVLVFIVIYIIKVSSQNNRGGYCNVNGDCKSGLICYDNVCIFDPAFNNTVFPLETCYAQTECPSNYFCSANGTCLLGTEKIIGERCKQDQECSLNQYCSCDRTCQTTTNKDFNYYTGGTNQYFKLIDSLNPYMGRTLDDNVIGFTDIQDTNNIFNYNSDIKLLNRVSNNVLVAVNENGIIINNDNDINNNLELYMKNYRNVSPENIEVDIILNTICILDEYGNQLHKFTNENTNEEFMSFCDDNINYTNNLSCENGEPVQFLNEFV